MPFADDVRKYTFASLDNLVSKKGETITEHPYIPTKAQLGAMEKFVDEMDLMEAGEKDEDGYVHFRHPVIDVHGALSNLGIATHGSIPYNPTTLLSTE
jgi:hypothetical protein